jgi:hypothetical protein
MHDRGKVLIGIAIFLVIVLFPIWFSLAGGGLGKLPESFPNPKAEGKSCVRDKKFMRESHMELLNDWRDEVVRDGNRDEIVIDGVPWKKSLTRTCLTCHGGEKYGYDKFCNACHTHAGVSPNCYECHNIPDHMTSGDGGGN